MALGRSEGSLKPLQTLWREGSVGSLTDGELLARFVASTGQTAEAAFSALVERHAPLVFLVCRQVLGEEHDANDASQATFLILAKQARSIKKPESLGSWLHGVAFRVAGKAKTAAARRRAHERRGAEMAARSEIEWNRSDPCPELHEEINRLPETYRLPLVLCYLEGLTHDQAAQRLGWPVGTVESRLARARDRLRKKLTRRGATPGVTMLSAKSLAEGASSSVPTGWIEATARSATQFAGGKAAATVASANVAFLTQGTLKTMALTQIKLVMAYSLSAALGATGLIALLQAVSTDPPKSPAVAPLQASKPAAERPDSAPRPKLALTTIKVSGRVLDPTGKPLQGSRLWLAFQGIDWTWSTRVPEARATTGSDGQFAFSVADSDPEVSRALRMTSGWPGGFGDIQIIASAEGFGPAWTGLAEIKGKIELRLVPDDIPVEGRLLTLEGRPIAGITVKTLLVEDPSLSPDAFGAPSGFFQSSMSDADGRFRLTGIGRARRAVLGFAGPGIAHTEVQAVTGEFPADHPTRFRGVAQVGSKFEHLCKPGKTIMGVVRDIDTGAPVPGMKVTSQFGSPISAVTDQQGRYRLDGLDKSPARWLIASARGGDQPYCASSRQVDDSAGYQPMIVDFQVVKGVVVTGRLTDRATGRPVQGWVAYAALRDNPNWSRVPGFQTTPGNGYRPMPFAHVPSMADGTFRLVVLPGKGFLVAHIQYQSDRFLPAGVPNKRMPGAPADALDVHYDTVPFELFPSNFPAVQPIDISAGTESITCDLTFDSGVVRSGSISDHEGRPLSGATLVGETRENFYQFKPTDGPNFTVYGLFRDPKLYRTVIFRHAEKGLGKTIRIDGSDPGPIEVRLEPMASLTGRLVDGAGKSLKATELRLLRIVSEPYVGANGEFTPPLQATADGDGRFRIDGIIPGTAYWLQTSQGTYFNRDFWTPRAGETKDLGNITPKAEH
jgi:RNA polymerase sigma factor (sigma-70 family)